jgi:hypothetical protein
MQVRSNIDFNKKFWKYKLFCLILKIEFKAEILTP